MSQISLTEASDNLYKADEAVGEARNDLNAFPSDTTRNWYNQKKAEYEIASQEYHRVRDDFFAAKEQKLTTSVLAINGIM
jgi:predicted translin family RNA/ssDNA-binding protein